MPHLQTHTRETAPEASHGNIDMISAKYGFLPNIFGVLAGSPAASGGYIALSSLLANSSLTPLEQQVVFLTVSRTNICGYCVAAHSTAADMLKTPADIIDALRSGAPLPDAKLEALRNFTVAMVEKRGWLDEADVSAFSAAGYGEAHILDVITGVAMKTISNYANHLAGTRVDDAFAPRTWEKAA
jgi:uncharacterized peroxidase-related enzyme